MTNVGVVIDFVFGVVLIAASAAFSAVDTAIFSMSPDRRRQLKVADSRSAAMLERLMEHPSDVANALLVANTITNLPLLVLVLHLAGQLGYADRLSGWGLLILGFFVVIVICDLLPKLAALAAPIRTTRLSLPLVQWLLLALEPAVEWLDRVTERIVALFLRKYFPPVPHLSDEELETLVEIGVEEGTFGEAESRLLIEVMRLADKPARHCMTPRVDAFTLPDDLTNEDAAALVRRKRYHFVPVRGETPDDILGLLDIREFLLRPGQPHYTERLQPPSFVPETMKAVDLLHAFLRHRQHMAILLDEFGGIEGVVTLSDIVEELLGEETPGSELYIEWLGGNRWLVAGSARLDDLDEQMGLSLTDKEIETVGGLVIEHYGSMPQPGDSFTIAGWRLTVRRATRKRIREVLIEPALGVGEGGGQ